MKNLIEPIGGSLREFYRVKNVYMFHILPNWPFFSRHVCKIEQVSECTYLKQRMRSACSVAAAAISLPETEMTDVPKADESTFYTSDFSHPQLEMDFLQKPMPRKFATCFHRRAVHWAATRFHDIPEKRSTLLIATAENKHTRDNVRFFPWIYSNFVLNGKELAKHAPCLVNVLDRDSFVYGVALYHPSPNVSAYLLHTNIQEIIDTNFFVKKIKNAIAFRDILLKNSSFFRDNNYLLGATSDGAHLAAGYQAVLSPDSSWKHISIRLINSDVDELPGLIVDRYNDFLCVEFQSITMLHVAKPLLNALQQILEPSGIIVKGNCKSRYNGGLDLFRNIYSGPIPSTLVMYENGCSFHIDLFNSPSTGWFLDRRILRHRVAQFCFGKRVLDLFSYTCGFGIQCAKNGKAEKVVCVDAFEDALKLGKISAADNEILTTLEFVQADASEWIRKYNEKEKFDVIIIDPPSLQWDTQKKQCLSVHLSVIKSLLLDAEKLLADAGMLILVVNLSKAVTRKACLKTIQEMAAISKRNAIICDEGGPSPDHPVHSQLPYSHLWWFILELKKFGSSD
ncbi:putative Ribosomal Rna large subunit methyltransferase I [Cardiosporidium cionae]|uniref:Ribosomal Rna large subunit methyltransferase I n=1 Tax=Cardiosporidium cionae TaxID=476202 RepID=A0ABQ7JDE5_9APIC|nr:putative Ribosomal Rna large subunit methyltransferase I [Cardiosporidium cionae]|eukprot:KAF8821996.1 putative Ribosomal Rna large subunit methyltransferase I [Cardiosporidium cionae]